MLWSRGCSAEQLLALLAGARFVHLCHVEECPEGGSEQSARLRSFSEQALLFAAMYSAERVAFTKRVILASWRETGMYPVGEAKIRKLMDQNLHAHDTGQPVSDTHFDHMIAVAYGKVSRDREEGQGGRTARCLVGSSETVQGIPQHAIQPRRRGTKA